MQNNFAKEEQTSNPPEGVLASNSAERTGTAGSQHPARPTKNKNQIFSQVSNLKNNRPICWYALNNICKFGDQCRNKHVTNTDSYVSKSDKNPTIFRPKFTSNFQTKNKRKNYQICNNQKMLLNSSLFNGYGENIENSPPVNSNLSSEESGSQLYFDIRGYHSVPLNQHLSQHRDILYQYFPENSQY